MVLPKKKKRGLRGTVVIFSERADAVTAGVLTKETVFFLFATIQTSISCGRVESLHGLDHQVE